MFLSVGGFRKKKKKNVLCKDEEKVNSTTDWARTNYRLT